ncbi:hypothetical protein HHI36_003097 [Cryptolaemus montrouzieri]|uniref:Uncharacterized protein n=1 Tax=Cryptolaemus montrouzieri TaxID=559131 RepID=A0ABD2PCG5_9CUCU
MKFLLVICLVIFAICLASGNPYGPRDSDIDSHHSRDGHVTTSIQRVDGHRGHDDRHSGHQGQTGRFSGGGSEGNARGETSIVSHKDSPFRY